MKQITLTDIEKIIFNLTKSSEEQYFAELDTIEKDPPALLEFIWSLGEFEVE